ncbi:MAG: DUF4329 domain-containing protein [Hyphomicrobiales bacterium]
MRKIILMLSLVFVFNTAHAVDTEELEFMKEFFSSIQQRTFDANREYCGHVGLDKDGYYITTEAKKGEEDSCLADDAPEGFESFASYHTHGAFSIDADSERPSTTDLEADIYEEVDGYIATPGGRIWFNDSVKQISTMLCENCVMMDPNFDESQLDPVKKSYTVEQLKARDETQ